MREIRNRIESWLVKDFNQISYPTVYKLTSEEVKDIVGTYESITERFPWMNQAKERLIIFENQGKIFTRLGADKAKQLIPLNARHFRRKNQPIATISIVKDEQSVSILQGDVGNYRKIK